MTEPTTPPKPASDFAVAQTVREALKDLPRDRQERVLRWVSELLGISPAPAPPKPTIAPTPMSANPAAAVHPPAAPNASHPPIDIRTFVDQKDPQTDIQYVTVAAYYFRFEAPQEQRRPTIDAEFAQETTRMAGRERLINPKSTLNNAKRQGYLDSPSRGQFAISTVGENLVVRGLPPKPVKK